VDYLVEDSKGTHIVEIVFKNPSNNLTMTDNGMNINTGKNIVAEMIDEIEVKNTPPTNEYRYTPAFLLERMQHITPAYFSGVKILNTICT